MPANLENSAVATGPEKVFIPTTKKCKRFIDLTKVEDVKKSWQEYTETIQKTVLMTRIITML